MEPTITPLPAPVTQRNMRILPGALLLLIHSIIILFGASFSPQVEGFWMKMLNLDAGEYAASIVAALCISTWMARSKAFNKQLGIAFVLMLLLELVAWFIPAGIFSLGILLAPAIIWLFALFAIALVVYNLTRPLANSKIIGATLSIVFLIILCPIVYVNINDMNVKNRLSYQSNGIFPTVQECDAYIFPKRRTACTENWNATQERWRVELIERNTTLDPNLKPTPGSENYQYYPPEKIKDIEIGTGETAVVGDIATVNVVAVTVQGKTYDQKNNPDLFTGGYIGHKAYLNPGYANTESYNLGIVGMKVGGTRDITFNMGTSALLTTKDGMISIPGAAPWTYTVELVSLAHN